MAYEFVGQDADDWSGYSVSSAGDVDADGQDDLLIAAYRADGVGDDQSDAGSVYLINANDLALLDAADGITDGIIDLAHVAATGTSYEFIGQDAFDWAGYSVASAGDVDNDGRDDLLIGAPQAAGLGNGKLLSGSTYLINANDLSALDDADGMTDGIINLGFVAATGTSYEFVGQDIGDRSGWSVSSAGDVDDDGQDDILIGAPFADGVGNAESDSGSTYLINSVDLAGLDDADGTTDGVINLALVANTGTSYEFVGQDIGDRLGWSVSSAGDVDGDRQDDLLIGAYHADGSANHENESGSTYLINAGDLGALDIANRMPADGIIDVIFLPRVLSSYPFDGQDAGDYSGWSVSSAGDVDGDGKDDLLIGAYGADGVANGALASGSVYLINANDFEAIDLADFSPNADLTFVAGIGTSYEFVGQDAVDFAGWSVGFAGDVDGDGKSDILIGAILADGVGNVEGNSGSTYLIKAADLAALDEADGTVDGRIDLGYVAATGTSYEFVGEDGGDESGHSVSSAGDVDGDGLDDLLIGSFQADGIGNGKSTSGSTYLIEADQLAAYDARDGAVDGVIDLGLIQCFLTGTQIATPEGSRPVEALGPGDPILTAEGRTVPVRFVLRQTISTRFGPADRLTPVRVRAGALGGGLPERDLVLTADHALLIDGLLVNAGALVNGSTIDWVPVSELGESFTVYHVETEEHDIILAEGAPAETFIDYVGRRAFDNYAEYVALYGEERIIAEMPEPRVTCARLLPPALRARLWTDAAA